MGGSEGGRERKCNRCSFRALTHYVNVDLSEIVEQCLFLHGQGYQSVDCGTEVCSCVPAPGTKDGERVGVYFTEISEKARDEYVGGGGPGSSTFDGVLLSHCERYIRFLGQQSGWS